MKWLTLGIGAALLATLFVLSACSGNTDSTNTQQAQTQTQPQNQEQLVAVTGESGGSCVACHTDKQMLIQTSGVVEEVTSEETTGEG